MLHIDKKSITKLSTGRVLVVGDIILDEFVIGSPERISREAPVIVLEQLSSNFALGGASNAAHNISALGARSYLLGVVGNDLYSKAIENESLKLNITPALVIDETRTTTVKTRILSIAHKHPTSSIQFKQQVLRLDRLSRKSLSIKTENELINKFNFYLEKCDVVLISDYELGLCSSRLIKHIIQSCLKKGKFVIVDSSKNFKRFKGAFIITPNQPDTEDAVGLQITDKNSLIKAGNKLLRISGAKNVLITRGSEGMILFSSDTSEKQFILPAFNVSEVFDVTGAGDTVAGVIACAISAKLKKETACTIANIAASLVVKKYGTAVTNLEELTKCLTELKHNKNGIRNGKIFNLKKAKYTLKT